MYLEKNNPMETADEFQAILYSIGDGVITTDLNSRVSRMNPVAERLTGWKETEARGKKLVEVFNIIDEVTDSPIQNPVEKVLQTGSIIELKNHTLLISRDGKRIPIADSGAPIRNNTQEIVGIVLVFRDESEDRKKKKMLKESETKFSTMFHSSPVGITISRANGILLDVNDIFLKTSGYTRDEIIGSESVTLGLWYNLEDRQKFLNELTQKGRVLRMEAKFCMKSGEIKTCFISAEIIELDNEKLILSTILDISDHKKAEDELKTSRAQLSSAIEIAHLGHWEYDVTNDVFTFNDHFYKMLRTSAEREGGYAMSAGEYIKRFVHPEDAAFVSKIIQEAIKPGESESNGKIDHRIKYGDGKTGTSSVRFFVVRNDDGQVIKTYGVNQDITERIEAEKAIRASEKKFSTAFHTSPDAVNINRLSDGLYLEVNEGFCKITGYKPEEVIGKTSLELNIWDDPKDREFLVNSIRQNGEVNNLEACFRKKDSKVLTGLMSARVMQINGVDCILTITRDITERKQAEEKIRKLSRGVEQSPATIVITDLNGNIEYVNPKFTETTGYSYEEAIGQNPSILKSEDKKPEEYRELWETIINKREWRGEFLNKKKDGTLFWEFASISPILNEEGEIMSFIAIKEDITEKKKMEEMLSNERLVLRTVIDNLPDAIFVKDIQCRKTLANLADISLMGANSEAEVIGKNDFEFYQKDVADKFYADDQEILISGKSEINVERSFVDKDGKSRWILTSKLPLRDGKDKIIGLVGISRDITKRKLEELELIQAKEKAEELSRLKSYFYANVSHELRTPFVGILGYAELLADSLKDPEEKEMAEVILKSSRRLTDTLNKILNIAKLEFEKPKINLTDVDLIELVNSIQTLYSKSAKAQNTLINTSFERSPLILKTDEVLLNEILTNLVSNAVKYCKNGLIKITAEEKREKNNELIIIKVSDNGIGIPKDKQDIIWQEFRQVSEGFNRTSEGTGLGLSLTKKYIELLNGRISLDSEPGKGSVFTITFPKNLVDGNGENSKSIQYPGSKNNPNEDYEYPDKILLVEDDKVSADFVKKALSKNYIVDISFTASDALQKAKNHQYPVLLLDINLGFEIDGIELLKRIKELPHYKDTPAIAMTAYASSNDREEFLSKGFSYYISKPFMVNDLRELLEKVLNKN